MKISWVQILVSLIVGIALGFTLVSWNSCKTCPYKCGGNKGKMVDRFSKKLDLTDNQRVKVQAIFDTKLEKMKALREKSRAKIKALLTPEQITKFDEMIAKREACRGG